MNFEIGIYMNLTDHETYLITHEMQLFDELGFLILNISRDWWVFH